MTGRCPRVIFVLAAFPLLLAATPSPQSLRTSALQQGITTEQTQVEQLNGEIATLTQDSADLQSRLDMLTADLQSSNDNLSALESASRDPSNSSEKTDSYRDAIAANEQVDLDEHNELEQSKQAIQERQAQLAQATPILQQMIASHIESVDQDQLSAQVAQLQGQLAELEAQHETMAVQFATNAELRRESVRWQQRGVELTEEHELSRAYSEETNRNQQLVGDVQAVQQELAKRNAALEQNLDRLQNARITLTGLTEELQRRQSPLAQIAHH